MSRRNSAFTLVELLIVVGIVVLLVAMLLPALSAARAQARSLKCLSNLRQLGQVVAMYAGENKTKLPFNFCWLAAPTTKLQDSVPPGLVNDGYIPKAPARVYRGWGNTAIAGANAPGMLICPAEDTELRTCNTQGAVVWDTLGFALAAYRNTTGSTKYPVLVTAGGDENGTIYSYVGLSQTFSHYSFNTVPERVEQTLQNSAGNYWPIKIYINGKRRVYENPFGNHSEDPSTGSGSTYMPHPQMSITAVKHSEDTWMAFDGAGADPNHVIFNGLNVIKSPDLNFLGVVFRHPKISANFVYFDGHAENLKTTDIDGDPLYTDCSDPTTPFPTAGGSISIPGYPAMTGGMIADERELLDH